MCAGLVHLFFFSLIAFLYYFNKRLDLGSICSFLDTKG
jgi:hypothetical protein